MSDWGRFSGRECCGVEVSSVVSGSDLGKLILEPVHIILLCVDYLNHLTLLQQQELDLPLLHFNQVLLNMHSSVFIFAQGDPGIHKLSHVLTGQVFWNRLEAYPLVIIWLLLAVLAHVLIDRINK